MKKTGFASPLVVMTLLFAGCGGGSGSTPTDGAAGSTADSGAGGSGGTAGGVAGSDGGGGSTGDAGGTAGAGGSGGTGGTGGGALPPLDDSGKASLMGMDGITGSIDGMTYAYTKDARINDMGTGYPYLLLSANASTGSGSWEVFVPKKLGIFPCAMVAQLQSGDKARVALNLAGVGGAPTDCAVEVTSIVGRVEGRFVAVLLGVAARRVPVVSGYFHFAMGGISDCSTAKDPGLAAGEEAATVAITKLDGQSPTYRCGDNLKLTNSASRLREIDSPREITFTGKTPTGRDTDLVISGLYGMGTFPCGMPGSAMPGAGKVNVSLGGWTMFQQGFQGGSCTVIVTAWTDALVEGTYTGVLWNSQTIQHSEMTVEGHFRGPRYKGP